MISTWFKERLKQESMTIETLSEKTGLSEAALQEIESGSRFPTQPEMCQLVPVLGMPMTYFQDSLGREDKGGLAPMPKIESDTGMAEVRKEIERLMKEANKTCDETLAEEEKALAEAYMAFRERDPYRANELLKKAQNRNVEIQGDRRTEIRKGLDAFRLREPLIKLINSLNLESESNTPDWILAHFLTLCLTAFNQAVNRRAKHYNNNDDERNPIDELELTLAYLKTKEKSLNIERAIIGIETAIKCLGDE